MKRFEKGQALLEYALLLVFVALLAGTLLLNLFMKVAGSAGAGCGPPHSCIWQ